MSPPLPPHQGQAAARALLGGLPEAFTAAAAVGVPARVYGTSGVCFLRVPGVPGIVGWASVPPSMFPRGSTASAYHQQWCGASWAAALPALGIPRLFILVRAGTRKCITRRFETSQFPGDQ